MHTSHTKKIPRRFAQFPSSAKFYFSSSLLIKREGNDGTCKNEKKQTRPRVVARKVPICQLNVTIASGGKSLGGLAHRSH